jgi:hypothetical protein
LALSAVPLLSEPRLELVEHRSGVRAAKLGELLQIDLAGYRAAIGDPGCYRSAPQRRRRAVDAGDRRAGMFTAIAPRPSGRRRPAEAELQAIAWTSTRSARTSSSPPR